MNTDDRTTSPATRILRMTALGVALLLLLAACGIGSTTKKSGKNPTATTSTTINLEASPKTTQAPARGTPAVASTPVVASPAASVSTPTSKPARVPSSAASPAASPGATPASGEAPVVTSCTPDSIPPFTGKSPDYTVKVDGLNFRAGPGTECDALGDPLAANTAVTVLSDPVVRKGESTEWVEVEVNGQDGWVAAEYISPAS